MKSIKLLLVVAGTLVTSVAVFASTVKVAASANPTITEYYITTGYSNTNQPTKIVTGADGALWFTNPLVSEVGRVTTGGSFTSYLVGNSRGIAAGPDGALWFTIPSGTIGRITTSGVLTEYAVPHSCVSIYNPTSACSPYAITSGPDGALWFTEPNSNIDNYIGRLTGAGAVTNYALPFNLTPLQIATGPDGALWFTAGAFGSSTGDIYQVIGRITIAGVVSTFTRPSTEGDNGISDITTGPDGALWFTDAFTNSIGRITDSGTITSYPLPTPNSGPASITAGPDGALWFTEGGSDRIGRITTSGTISEYSLPNPTYTTMGITMGPDSALWFTEGNGANRIGRITTPVLPAPANLAASSPTQNPSPRWDPDPGAAFYNIYRNGTKVDSTTASTYTDDTAPEGNNAYFVTAVDSSGAESSPSNSVYVLVDRTPPTITHTVSPAPNSSSWNNSPTTVTFSCSDVGSGIQSCSAPQTESIDGTYTLTGTATDKAGNSASVTAAIDLDQTPPSLGAPSWTANPAPTIQSTTVSVPVTDELSGVAGGEYYVGAVDPGQGNGTPMTLSNGTLSATFASGTLMPGIYQVSFRAEDIAGNWSPGVNDDLVVYDASNSGAEGHSNSLLPIYGTDILPGLMQAAQIDTASFALHVRYTNGNLNPSSTIQFAYDTGTQCNNANKAINCHTITVDSTSVDWLVINGNNNFQATIQGTASVTVDGTTTTNAFRVVATDGHLLNPGASDTFEILIFSPGASPYSASPLYTFYEPLTSGNVVVKG